MVLLGLLLALASAFTTNVGFLLRHRGAVEAPVRHGASPAAQRDRPVPVEVVDDRLPRRVRRLRVPRRGAGAGVALDGAGGARGRARAARRRGRALVRLPPRPQGVDGRRPDGRRPRLPRAHRRRPLGPGVGRVLGRGDARLRERPGRHRHDADPLSPHVAVTGSPRRDARRGSRPPVHGHPRGGQGAHRQPRPQRDARSSSVLTCRLRSPRPSRRSSRRPGRCRSGRRSRSSPSRRSRATRRRSRPASSSSAIRSATMPSR